MNLAIALVAALFERLNGYPQALVNAIGHPVIWIGKLIGLGDEKFNRLELPFAARQLRGALVLAAILAVVAAISLTISFTLRAIPYGWIVEAVLASSLLAQKGLRDAVLRVAKALAARDIPAAREAVSHIVGRDTANLDRADIARAATETLAENGSDGVIAPMFYLAIFGLPGAAVYKAINTADSMIGHRSERHEAFGWAAARLDDVVNFIPARLTALLLVAVAGAGAANALRAVRRDASKHASPNAGWPESAMAGALGISLGGPRAYHGELLDLPTMGDGRRELAAEDISAAIRLYDRMLWLVWALLALFVVFWAL
jgi:adenosylcobinamide-phosphate synthase